MATTRTRTRRGKAKAAEAEAAPAKASGNGRRTHEDILDLVPEIVEKLKAGTLMKDIRAEYGAGPVIRKALTEKGYNTKGERIEVEEISGTGATLAKRVAAKREDGWPWYKLELATGKSQDELKDLLEEHGYEELAVGRVILAEEEEEPAPAPKRTRGRKAAAKAEPEAEAEAETPKRTRSRRTRKAAANPS